MEALTTKAGQVQDKSQSQVVVEEDEGENNCSEDVPNGNKEDTDEIGMGDEGKYFYI